MTENELEIKIKANEMARTLKESSAEYLIQRAQTDSTRHLKLDENSRNIRIRKDGDKNGNI